ncbi:MAG: hypothetical protein ACI8UO_003521 [Verrucomicrobiales bacterium]|jgi:hypothetical protein
MPVKVKRIWWKLAIGILIVFLAGFVSGVIGTAVFAAKMKERAEDPEIGHQMAVDHLARKLNLDETQRAEVSGILEEMIGEVVQLRDDTRLELGEITEKYAPRIFALLREDQKSRFSDFLAELGRKWKVAIQAGPKSEIAPGLTAPEAD